MLECGGTNLSSLDVGTCLYSFDPLDYDWLDEMIKVHFFLVKELTIGQVSLPW